MKALKQIKFLLIILATLLLPFNQVYAQKQKETPQWYERKFTDDFVDTLKLIKESSYKQMQHPHQWAIFIAGGLTLWPLFNSDKKLSIKYSKTPPGSKLKFYGGTLSNVFLFPVIPATTYFISRHIKNKKLYDFTIEYTASLYLTLIETGLISLIPIHRRPAGERDLDFWEKNFRLKSSFPSGHIVSFTTLTFKTWQYYGGLYAILPAFAAVIASVERVRSKKHYVSDVFGTIFLSLLANEGTRIAYNKPEHLSPVYKWIFQHEMKFGLQMQKKNFYASLSLTY